MSELKTPQAWYKEPWPWLLMAGPVIVIFAALYTFYIAQSGSADLVSDDYYKDGKHINLQLHRDETAYQNNIHAQVLINPDKNSAKVLISGRFNPQKPLNLVLIHPAQKAEDQTVRLLPAPHTVFSSNKLMEYNAVFKPLPHAHHWYVRVEDAAGTWRIENRWLVSQGNAINLKPMQKLSGSE